MLKAFEQSKAMAVDALIDTSATKVTLPFVEEQVKAARELMGEDFWSYGVTANRKALEAFLRHHHAQGLSSRLVAGGRDVPPLNAREFQALASVGSPESRRNEPHERE